MVKRFKTYIIGIIALTLIGIHSVFWCSLLFWVFLAKICTPKNSGFFAYFTRLAEWLGRKWIASNGLILTYICGIKFNIIGKILLKPTKQYFVTCNHQSWSDILILQHIFLNKIAFIRFFIKKQLMWLPFLNIAFFAYDFPVMHRLNKRQIERNPSLKGKDMLNTQKACAKFKDKPLTLLNFLEGTRNTPKKHALQNSPYKHLLKPKAGGLAYALEALEHRVVDVIDVTIIYPRQSFHLIDFLGGAVKEITIHLSEYEIPTQLLSGSYSEDTNYRKAFQSWVAEVWAHKDKIISGHSKHQP